MKILVIVDFATGDSDTPYWHVPTVLECDRYDAVYDIEKRIAEFLNSNQDDLEYEEIVDEVMKATDYKWRFTGGYIPRCHCMHTIWVE